MEKKTDSWMVSNWVAGTDEMRVVKLVVAMAGAKVVYLANCWVVWLVDVTDASRVVGKDLTKVSPLVAGKASS